MEGQDERRIWGGTTEISSFGSVVALGADILHAASMVELEIAP